MSDKFVKVVLPEEHIIPALNKMDSEGYDLIGSVLVSLGKYYSGNGFGDGFSTSSNYMLMFKLRS